MTTATVHATTVGTPSPSAPEARRMMRLYLTTGLGIAGVLMLAGLAMRMTEAGWLHVDTVHFYALLTLHGVGMISALVLCGMGGLWYLIRRRVKMSLGLGFWAWGLIVAGVLSVALATMIGRFGTGWTFLYPLPFVNPSWPSWSIGTFLIGMTFITVGWTVWCVQILEAVLRGFGGFRGALGWDMIMHPKAFEESGREPVPPEVLPALVISFDGLFASTAATLLGVSLLVHWISPSVGLDALWAKNITYFFGHTIANFIIYMLVALIYVGLPRYTGREYHNSRVHSLGWWGSMLFLIIAYPHHLYMDFAQPVVIQYIGEIATYLSAIPVAVVTVYGMSLLIWRSKMKWALGSIFMYAGLTGWIVGGVGGLLDASIPFNVRLHNTLWVPAHFHTYLLGSSILFAIGWVFLLLEERSKKQTPLALRWVIGVLVLGGIAMFLASFYISGANSVPRRYATEPGIGPLLAGWGSAGAITLLTGFLVLLVEGVRLWLGGRGTPARAETQPEPSSYGVSSEAAGGPR